MGAKILTAEGHQVSTVSNGQAAIQALEKAVPDLVVADVFMPGRNGYEVCHFVKTDARLKGIPVLLIIGAMEPYDPEEGRRAGADGLITKPLESSNLLNTVKDLLNSSKRFAPARAAVERETTSGKVVLETSGGTPVEEPQWEEGPEEEIITTPPQQETLEIPKEMGEQAIGMLSGMMDEPTAPPPLPTLEAAAAPETAMGLAAIAVPAGTPAATEDLNDPDGLLSDPAAPPQLDIAEKSIWVAEVAALTPEEEKLFEQPAANWGDLEQMVEQSAAEPATPPPLPWQTTESTPDLELAAEAPDPQFIPDALLEAPLAEIPVTQDALLQVAEKTVAPTATESELESYENLTDTVRAQGPIRTMKAPPPPIAAEPEPPAAVAVESSTENSAPPQPPSFSGPVEELEAAPSERNISRDEAAAEAAAEVDPATLEHIIRGVVGELMPQIIAQVKQALKS